MKTLIITAATLALAATTFAYTPSGTLNDRPETEKQKVEKPEGPEKAEKPEKHGHKLHAGSRSNCPIYYGCPAPAPAPGGGKKGGEPQPHALHV